VSSESAHFAIRPHRRGWIASCPDVAEAQATASALASVEPLCVDLDGTLVKSDTLLDSVVVLARQSFRSLLHFPAWIVQGKAAFKRTSRPL